MTGDGGSGSENGSVTIDPAAIRGSRRATRRQVPLLRTESAGSGGEVPVEVPLPLAKLRGDSDIHILHVDDNPDVGELVETFLEEIGDDITVLTETNAVAALERLGEERIDCVISDYRMPNTDGLEFLELVREQYPDLPFILFTGEGSEQLASEAIAAGVTDYMPKGSDPDTYEVLANRVENAVEGYRTEQSFWNALSWYQRLVEQELAGVCIVQDGEFVYVNRTMAEMFSYTQDELVGQPPEHIVVIDEADRFAAAFDDGTEEFQDEFVGRRSDGGALRFDISGGVIEFEGAPAWIGVVTPSDASG